MSTRLAALQQVQRSGDCLLFARIFAFALVAPLLLRLPHARLRALVEPHGRPPATAPGTAEHIIDLVNAAVTLGRPLVHTKCYTRGLTLYRFLNRAGVDVSLWFGVETFDGQLAGHCWLVKDGAPYLEPDDPASVYTPVFTLPGIRASANQHVH